MANFDGMTWRAPFAVGGSVKGLNDSGIETFKGHSVSALTREICQNSLDARKDPTKPVVVEFSTFRTQRNDFPNRDEFAKELEIGKTFWEGRNDKQAAQFFRDARGRLNSEINWIRISDFNTTGLTGVSQAQNHSVSTAWNALVKSSGVSEKSTGSVGSFGIGKSAPFSCSYSRTVFYATKAENETGFAGVARLLSRPTSNANEMTIGDVYFEKKDGGPYSECISLDSEFTRKETGTDIYIPGFVPLYDIRLPWAGDIINAVLDGFLYAIYNESLIVRITHYGGKPTEINKAFLRDRFENKTFLKDDKFNRAIQQKYELLTDPNVRSFKFEWPRYEGHVDVRFLLGSPDYDRRVTVVRTPGMKIFDKGHFPAKILFTGMLIVCGKGLNGLFKRLENPAHTDWEADRSAEGKEAMDALFTFCKEQLRNLVMTDATEEIDSGLGAILPQEEEGGVGKQQKDSITPIAKSIVPTTKRKRKVNKDPVGENEEGDEEPSAGEEPSDGMGSGGGEHTGTSIQIQNPGMSGPMPGSFDGPNAGHNQGMTGETPTMQTGKSRPIECMNVRSCCYARKDGIYRVTFKPSKDASNATLEVFSAAEKNCYVAPLLSAKNVTTGKPLEVNPSAGKIEGLVLKKGVPIVLELKFDYSDYLSLEVECHGYC